jgi:hypothetical protein
MKKLSVARLVRTAVAQSVKGIPPREILDKSTLRALGYGQADILQLRTRLFKAFSGKKEPDLSQFERVLNLTPESTVKEMIEKLPGALPTGILTVHGDDPTQVKLKEELEGAVCVVLSESTPSFDFSQIQPDMTLGNDLKLDDAAIAEVKINLFKTLGSKGSRFSDFIAAVDVGGQSTVKSLIEQTFKALPGYDPTKPK